jgi:hypothetical protein
MEGDPCARVQAGRSDGASRRGHWSGGARQHGLRSQRTTGQERPDSASRIATTVIPVSAILSSMGSFSRPTLGRRPAIRSLSAGWWSLPPAGRQQAVLMLRVAAPRPTAQPRVSQVRPSLQTSYTQPGSTQPPDRAPSSARHPHGQTPKHEIEIECIVYYQICTTQRKKNELSYSFYNFCPSFRTQASQDKVVSMCWIGDPPSSGRYFVRLTLYDLVDGHHRFRGRPPVLDVLDSEVFEVN